MSDRKKRKHRDEEDDQDEKHHKEDVEEDGDDSDTSKMTAYMKEHANYGKQFAKERSEQTNKALAKHSFDKKLELSSSDSDEERARDKITKREERKTKKIRRQLVRDEATAALLEEEENKEEAPLVITENYVRKKKKKAKKAKKEKDDDEEETGVDAVTTLWPETTDDPNPFKNLPPYESDVERQKRFLKPTGRRFEDAPAKIPPVPYDQSMATNPKVGSITLASLTDMERSMIEKSTSNAGPLVLENLNLGFKNYPFHLDDMESLISEMTGGKLARAQPKADRIRFINEFHANMEHRTRDEDDEFLTDPIKPTDRRCANNENCEGMKNKDWYPVILKEFLTPKQRESYRKTGMLPQNVQLCVMCQRAYAQNLFTNLKSPAASNHVPAFLPFCNSEEDYDVFQMIKTSSRQDQALVGFVACHQLDYYEQKLLPDGHFRFLQTGYLPGRSRNKSTSASTTAPTAPAAGEEPFFQ